MKHEDYFDITQVEGVTPEMIKAYKSFVRRERYLEEVDAKHRTYHYGYINEIEHLLGSVSDSDNSLYSNTELVLKLRNGLTLLKKENKLWYDAIMAYFYSDGETSYSIIAKDSGVSKQSILELRAD